MATFIFSKDNATWSVQQKEELEQFFLYNSFFNKFYTHEHFHQIADMSFYAKIPKDRELHLNLNKTSEVLVLLSGEIEIYKKEIKSNNKKQKNVKKINHYISL
jgi:hypothetical protein